MNSGLSHHPAPSAAPQIQPVYFVEQSRPGRLGFTLAPGRHGRDQLGRFWTRDLEEDLHHLESTSEGGHPTVLLLLLTPEELDEFRISGLTQDVAHHHLELRPFPLPKTVSDITNTAVLAIVHALTRLLEEGRTVILVSGDALERGPLVAASYLMAQENVSAEAAVRTVRSLRGPPCISTESASWLQSHTDRPALSTASAHSVASAYRSWSQASATTRAEDHDLPPRGTPPQPSSPAPSDPSDRSTPSASSVYVDTTPPSLFSDRSIDPPASGWTAPGSSPVWATTSPSTIQEDGVWTPLESVCIGAVLGAAAGDAMGVPLAAEEDWSVLYKRYGIEGPSAPPTVGKGPQRLRQAVVSSHTDMLENTLLTLISARPRRLELSETLGQLAQRLGRWAHTVHEHGVPAPSGRTSCLRIAKGEPWTEVGANSEQGAAGLARAIAFGLVFADDMPRVEAWAAAQSRITHRAASSVASAAALAVGMAHLTRGDTWNHTFSEMVAAACRVHPETASRLARALHEAQAGLSSPGRNRLAGSRSTQDTLIQAVAVLHQYPDDFETAVRTAVMSTGDAHAVGASVGALLGCKLGGGALPPHWLGWLERKSTLEGLALALASVRS